MTRARLNRTAVVFGIWTAPVIGGVVAVLRADGNVDFAKALIAESIFWYYWAFVTLGVLPLLDRVPFSRRSWPTTTLLHVAVAAAVILVHVAVSVGAAAVTGIALPEQTIGASYVTLLRQILLLDVGVYILVVLVGLVARVVRIAAEHKTRAAQLESQLSQARLAALTAQLQPHFLFNSLNTVASLVRTQDSENALRVVIGLSTLLRRVLDTAPNEVPLRDEVDLLCRYLEVEQIRFGNRLSVAIDTPPETLDILVPVLILQPLAENAVRHGIASRERGGTLTVRASLRDSVLRLEVSDDGPGWPIQATVAGDAAEHRSASGVGLRNTRDRLTQLYGDEARVKCSTGSSGGATIVLELPARSSDMVLDVVG